MKIFVVSSWNNPLQKKVCHFLAYKGHEVYDLTKSVDWENVPIPHIEGQVLKWSKDQYLNLINSEFAKCCYNAQMDGIKWADACVLVTPGDSSSNIIAGIMKGIGKAVYVFRISDDEPDFMHLIGEHIFTNYLAMMNQIPIEAPLPNAKPFA